MKKIALLFSIFSITALCFAGNPIVILSPSGSSQLKVNCDDVGNFTYEMKFNGKLVLSPSKMGMKISSPDVDLYNFTILGVDSSLHDDTWQPILGEQRNIRNNYRELFVKLQDKKGSGILLSVRFRLFDDGVGFRYEFPSQEKLDYFIVKEETTQFALNGDHKAFWIPGDYDTNEYGYSTTLLSEIENNKSGGSQEIHAKTPIGRASVQTPLMMKSNDGLYINIHEAALINYPAMNLDLQKGTNTFMTQLVPDAYGNKAYVNDPAHTPWRTVIVSDKAASVLMSRIILNLNEPTKYKDVTWIKASKFVGVWWEMHVGIASWDLKGGQVASSNPTSIERKVRHGANTENVKRYIDFAAKHGFEGVLVEGWNTGWEDWFGHWKEDVFDFVTPYPDFDVKVLHEYAKSKGVKIIMHHETSGSATNYERYMDTAYRFMVNNGYNSVKSGYVGKIIPRGEHHDGQWMVKHYERVAKKTADYKIMVAMHEPVRPTGLSRTYPNWITSEAARGNEFNAWSEGNKPDHETILPFTRLMGGPMDYTPGIFKIKMTHYDPTRKEQVHTTLTKQLALYVTMYSPLQMAADLPENYETKMDAFQFIKDVAVDWDESIVTDAEPGDYIVEARKAKGADRWFMGAITDENARNLVSELRFLEKGKKYVATIYRDADNADWDKNPEAYVIEKFIVTQQTKLNLKLAPGGGTAISLLPATEANIKQYKKYK